MNIAFDTLQFATRLKEAGFTEAQAVIIIELQKEAAQSMLEQARQDYHSDDLATKRDLDNRIKETELKIELVRSDLKRDIAETKVELIRWVVGMGILQSTLLIGALMKMAKLI